MAVLDAPVQAEGRLEARLLESSLAAASDAYARANPESARRYQAATAAMPGGNTRSVLYYAPFPLCIVRGEGSALWDADGHRYTDMLAEFTAGIYGHSDPVIRSAIESALRDGSICRATTLSKPNWRAWCANDFPRSTCCASRIPAQKRT